MKILAIETSTEFCSVALWQDGVVSEKSENVGQKHSEILMVMLDGLLQQAGVKLAQLDGIAFGEGPGSFTGVRIACGVAQGLALGANLPVIGICTLQAVAQGSGRDKVIAALDARMAEVYFAVYEKHEGAWHAVCAPCLCLPQEAPAVAGSGWQAAGSGFAAHGEVLQAHYAGQLAAVDAACVPQAGAIAALAAPLFAAGKGLDAALAMPLYLRDKVALKTSERLPVER
ncbi:MAG: tRNA (adenosine(37)-N6)-threonylcarbamoyltransferase complex dimerization subunit type 1 TsaB [Gallionellaceae bacterium]|jgi:tRNA threonylcarbamoyladenosine biosynthesis protein TsaB